MLATGVCRHKVALLVVHDNRLLLLLLASKLVLLVAVELGLWRRLHGWPGAARVLAKVVARGLMLWIRPASIGMQLEVLLRRQRLIQGLQVGLHVGLVLLLLLVVVVGRVGAVVGQRRAPLASLGLQLAGRLLVLQLELVL